MSQDDFYFLGRGPLSKSLLNRALIVKSWFSHFSVQGTSLCDDIRIMSSAIKNFKQKQEIHCGLSGTAFRFLAFRLSREKGEFLLTADPPLLKRPLQEILSLLPQLSVRVEKRDNGFFISSKGWRLQGDGLHIPSQNSSQYSSALVLNSWKLDQDLYFSLSRGAVSHSYFQMTLNFVKKLGMEVQQNGQEFFIPKNQILKKSSYTVEQDKSCLFALAVFAVIKGQAIFLDWEEVSLQPDNIFPKILSEMGVIISFENKKLIVSKCENLKPINISLKETPDLFPMLSVLCAKAEGTSQLKDISHLAFKESPRIEKTQELLKLCGIESLIKKEVFLIHGRKIWPKVSPFVFDSAKDHRMAMAGALAQAIGVPVTVKGEECVSKSFPGFHSLVDSAIPSFPPSQSFPPP